VHSFRAFVFAVSKRWQRVSPEHHPPLLGWLSIAVRHLLLVSAAVSSWPRHSFHTTLCCVASCPWSCPHLTSPHNTGSRDIEAGLGEEWAARGTIGSAARPHWGHQFWRVAMDRQITCQVALLSPWVAQSRQLHLLLQLLLWLRLLLLQEKVSMVLCKTLPPQDGCRVVFQKPLYGQGPSILPIVRV